MQHYMHLNDEPYQLIKQGIKTIELRLYDEKRKLLNIGDTIKITNRKDENTMIVEIENLHKYPNFKELYNDFDKKALGYHENEIADPKDMDKYYSLEEQNKYGVVGIQIKVI